MGDPITSFWSKVMKSPEEDGCWVWTAGRGSRARQAKFMVNGLRDGVRAHRYAYELANGPIPQGLVVRHRCHNGLCVRPSHLSVGTQAQNVQDTIEAGRQSRGERHPHARLTEEVVRQARSIYAEGGVSYADLARAYGVGESTIANAIKGINWKHVV